MFEDTFTFQGFFAPEKRLAMEDEGGASKTDLASAVAASTGIDVEAAHHALTPEEHIQKAVESWNESHK